MSTVCIRKKKIPIFAINKRRTDRPSFIIFATLSYYEVLNFKRYKAVFNFLFRLRYSGVFNFLFRQPLAPLSPLAPLASFSYFTVYIIFWNAIDF